MKVLVQATQASHNKKLQNLRSSPKQQYSRYPVHEAEFWEKLFAFGKNPKTAQKVLDEIAEIEAEPCIENERVYRSVETAKKLAQLTLLQKSAQ